MAVATNNDINAIDPFSKFLIVVYIKIIIETDMC